MRSKILEPINPEYWKDVPENYCVVDARVKRHPACGWGKLTIPVDISSVVTSSVIILRGNELSEEDRKGLADRILGLDKLVYTPSRYTSNLIHPMFLPISTNDLIRAMLKIPDDFNSYPPISPDTIPPYVIQLLDKSKNIKTEYPIEPDLDLDPSVGTQRDERRKIVQLATPSQ